VAHAARLLGRAIGDSSRGDSLAAAIDTFLAAPPPVPTSRVAFVVWDNPPIVIGAGSYLDELARLAGASNVFTTWAARRPRCRSRRWRPAIPT